MSAVVALVVAKAPIPGRVKTRLGAEVGMRVAAQLAAAALLDTMAACERAFGPQRCHLALDGDLRQAEDGQCLVIRLRGWTIHRQRGASFGARLNHAYTAAAVGGAAVVQVGMDTPQVTAAQLRSAGSALRRRAAVIGPARDGGWWLLGLRDATMAALLASVPMSTPRTYADTMAALRTAGVEAEVTDALDDIDTSADAHKVAALAPWTRFASVWADIRGDPATAAAGARTPILGGQISADSRGG
jgi:rSAM/selenodomain-associated transferase 1